MASAQARTTDLVIVTPEAAEKLKLDAKPLARVGIGVAVHESAPLPDISTRGPEEDAARGEVGRLHQPGNGNEREIRRGDVQEIEYSRGHEIENHPG